MCSEPIKHTDKETGEVIIFACRTCNQCIAARRSGWIDRGMAERACHPYSLCVTLTYNTATEGNRDARRMFQYSDVMAFLKRLRRAAVYMAEKHKWNVVPYVRFICAGEQGERGENHCHWHLVLYTNFDIRAIGEFQGIVDGEKRVLTYPRDEKHLMSIRKRKRRLDWSIWADDKKPKGFVTLGEADLKGMHYVLSYCLKDQFAAEKAEGTMREAKSEAFATGLFRMSKRPAIGEQFIVRKMEDLLAKGAVLPSLMIPVPDVDFKWWPTGAMREKALWHLSAVNRRIRWATGADAPQWSSLLASVSENEKELEILDGQETEKNRIEREKGATLVARLENIRDYHYETVFKNRWLVTCQRCLRLPNWEWTWKETGTLRYDKEKDALVYRSFGGVDSLDDKETKAKAPGDCRCETCWRRDNLIAIREDGQRARHQARWEAGYAAFEARHEAWWEAKYGSSQMPPG